MKMNRNKFVKEAKKRVGNSGEYLFKKYQIRTDWCLMQVYDLEHDTAGVSEIPKNFSCSGFMNTDFAKARKNRDFKTAEIGDIVFFELNGNRADGADHVGIVVENTGHSFKLLEGNVRGNSSGIWYDTSTSDIYEYDYYNSSLDWIIDMSEFFTDDEEEPEEEPVEEPAAEEGTFTVTLRTLRKGMKGNDVKALQRLLFTDGYSVGQTFDDGDFGECTEKGVKEYQTDHKLEVDGIVGAQTFAEFWKK